MILTIIFLSILGFCILYYIAAGIVDVIDDKLYDREKVLYNKYYTTESPDDRAKIGKEKEKFESKAEKFHNLTSIIADPSSCLLPIMVFIGIIFLFVNLINGIVIFNTYNHRYVNCANEKHVSTYSTLVNALSNEANDPNYIVPQVIEWDENYITYLNHKNNPWFNWYNNDKEWEGTGYIDITEFVTIDDTLSEYEDIELDEKTIEKFGFAYIRFKK